MSNGTYALAAASQHTIAAWQRALPIGDIGSLDTLLAEHVTFHSPAVRSPIAGREAIGLVLATVADVLANIRYRRTFAAGPRDAALEFSAEIGSLHLTGIDLMRLDGSGLIVEFEVLIRPLKPLAALAEAIGDRIALRLLQLKRTSGQD